MAEATAIREKEVGEFATLSSELETNIADIGKAVAAQDQQMLDVDRQDKTACCSQRKGD